MLIKGNTHTDNRGSLSFVNDFSLQLAKRFYTISHPDTITVRAWQGHKIESKYFFVVKGKFLFGWVEVDDWETPSVKLEVNRQVLTSESPSVLKIGAGFANGFKALEPDSIVLVFSDLTAEESNLDMYRFDKNLWNL